LGYGTVLEVVELEHLLPRAHEIAAVIASKNPRTIRAAKRSANGIEEVDVRTSYRFEQGFTFELNLAGEGDRARDAFINKER
jgi:enoyl-CoA hydratase